MKRGDILNLVLSAGQCEQVLVEAGSQVVVIAGRAAVRQPPRWLSEHMLGLTSSLAEGEPLTLEDGGWIEISARMACRVLVIPPEPGIWSRFFEQLFAPNKPERFPESDVDQGMAVVHRTESRFASVPGALFKEP